MSDDQVDVRPGDVVETQGGTEYRVTSIGAVDVDDPYVYGVSRPFGTGSVDRVYLADVADSRVAGVDEYVQADVTPDTGEIPKYVREPVERQDIRTLRAVRYLVDRLIAEKREPDPDDLDGDVDQSTLDDLSGGGSTTVIKEVECGKSTCSTCPHGPYEYQVSWNGESLDWTYIGPASDGDQEGSA